MHFLYDLDAILCPSSLPVSMTAIICAVSAFTALMFAMATLVRYNSLTLYEAGQQTRITQTSSVCNTLWVLYFLHVFLRKGFDGIRYGLDDSSSMWNTYLAAASVLVHGLTVLFLTLSLDYQRKFRRGDYMRLENFLLEDHYGYCKKMVDSIALYDALYMLAFLCYEIAACIAINDSLFQLPWTYWVYVGATAVQFLPVLVLTMAICCSSVSEIYLGPNRWAKTALFLATLLSIPALIPLSVWKHFILNHLPSECLGSGISAYDPILLGWFVGLVLYFWFVRSEYLRNKEQELYNFYQQCQDCMNMQRL